MFIGDYGVQWGHIYCGPNVPTFPLYITKQIQNMGCILKVRGSINHQRLQELLYILAYTQCYGIDATNNMALCFINQLL